MIPTMVSAGPTITLSRSSWLKGSGSGGLEGAVVLLQGQGSTGVWCFGTGGGLVLGTWLSMRAALERFSELRLRLRLVATWFDKLQRLDAEFIWFWVLRAARSWDDWHRGLVDFCLLDSVEDVDDRIPGEDFLGGKGGGTGW